MTALVDDFGLTAIKNAPDIPAGLNAAVYKLAGRVKSRRAVAASLLKSAAEIHENAKKWRECSDGDLRSALSDFRVIFRRRETDGMTASFPEALGAIMEATHRTLGLRPYVVQAAGACALYKGYIAEMATGEGKTVTAALCAVVRGWSGLPCHVITANDYLAERDAKNLSSLYGFCGVTVGNVAGGMKPPERKQGYANDITYSTAKEVTADFLRDRLSLGPLQHYERRQIGSLLSEGPASFDGVVTRGIHTAIVDEVDSLLIDEAVTPLIISRGRENEPFVKACRAASAVAATLRAGVHYTVDFQYKDIEILPAADIHAALAGLDVPRQFTGEGFQRELIHQALVAKEFFHRDKQYVVADGKVVIVDEFTGRTMAQRSWSAGLHQLIEAKENLEITPPTETLARLSFQRYFRFYHILSGMTGTARESASELWHLYGLPVIRIPENKPLQRVVFPRKVFLDQESKCEAILSEIEEMHALGRPVLVGTRSVQASENLASRLNARGYSCRIINAVRHKEEAAIIAEAGKRGAITVATNMAGRGTDIILERGVEPKGGLHVIATECNESGRIDRQLFGRSGRQGDKGSARSFVSVDDELLRRYLNPLALKVIDRMMHLQGGVAHYARKMAGVAVIRAQNNAQKRAFASRKAVQKTDTWLRDSLSFGQGEF